MIDLQWYHCGIGMYKKCVISTLGHLTTHKPPPTHLSDYAPVTLSGSVRQKRLHNHNFKAKDNEMENPKFLIFENN